MSTEQLSQLQTVIYGYLWVSYADGDIASEEVEKFRSALDSVGIPVPIDEVELQHMFDDARDFFRIKFDEASMEARGRMEDIVGDQEFVAKLINVCRRAIVADEVLEEREEVVIKRIAKIVGFEKP